MIGILLQASITSIFNGSYQVIYNLIQSYGYGAIVALMTIEGTSLPVPSEVVIPLAGFFAEKGALNIFLAFFAVLIGNTLGMAIDYAIGYYLGKDVIYKHLEFFHVKKESLDNFDKWFNRNGSFAVFISRMIPEVRSIMSIPAGFAKMPLKKFFFWSILGSAIWDAVLMAFGYYALSTSNIAITFAAIGLFVVALYIIFRYAMKKMRKG